MVHLFTYRRRLEFPHRRATPSKFSFYTACKHYENEVIFQYDQHIPEQLPNELPEIDALLRHKIECQLPSVPTTTVSQYPSITPQLG